MPICEADPWRLQYFENIPCPENVRVPTEDPDAYLWYPEFKWVYNKLLIAESQGLICGPHGVEPPEFPVFSKPIMNMRGMGMGSKVLKNHSEYKRLRRPGHMWMKLLQGDHVSTDVAVVNGDPVWWCHARGIELPKGMFDYWIVEADLREDIIAYCSNWIKKHLAHYSGMLNIETIDSRIIEIHLRFADQWPDLYGAHWVESVIDLYQNQHWRFENRNRREGYSVVLFGSHGVQYHHPKQEILDAIVRQPFVTSVQITFHEDWPLEFHAMPPGGFRLAIINGYDLEKLKQIRQELALEF